MVPLISGSCQPLPSKCSAQARCQPAATLPAGCCWKAWRDDRYWPWTFSRWTCPARPSTDINWESTIRARSWGSYTAGGITHGFVLSEGSLHDARRARRDLDRGLGHQRRRPDRGQLRGRGRHARVRPQRRHLHDDRCPRLDTHDAPRHQRLRPDRGRATQTLAAILHGFLLQRAAPSPRSTCPARPSRPMPARSTTPARSSDASTQAAPNVGYLLSEGTYTTLDVPDSISSAALGINEFRRDRGRLHRGRHPARLSC